MGQMLALKNALAEVFNVKRIDQSDLEWIFVTVLNISRSELSVDRELSIKEVKRIYKLAKLRIKGVPLSQVLGFVNFYGLDVEVNKHVLSPRPETELLVDEVLKDIQTGSGLDIGTGSGAIAISLNKLGKFNMTAVDISGKALRVAKRNNRIQGTNVKFVKSDLFKKVNGTFDFIVSNPPYIRKDEIEFLDCEVKNHEPILALCGGESGFDYYEKIIKLAPNYLKDNGKIYFELGINQADYVKTLLEENFCDIKVVCDYNTIERIIKATKK